jgi:ribosomal protein S18 acetylase RimI-like enzyme
VRHPFDAQTHQYREHYPTATFDLILVDGEPAGRLYVDRWPTETRIMDIALMPEWRGRGVGRELIEQIQAEGRDVSVHVERFNPAQRLYARLGFESEDAGPVYLLMRWAAPR